MPHSSGCVLCTVEHQDRLTRDERREQREWPPLPLCVANGGAGIWQDHPAEHVQSSHSGRVAAEIRISHPPHARPHPPKCPRGRCCQGTRTECLPPSCTPSLLLRTPQSCFSAREIHGSLDFPGVASTTGSQGPHFCPDSPGPRCGKASWLPWASPRPGHALLLVCSWRCPGQAGD